jgi:hypothetical protein
VVKPVRIRLFILKRRSVSTAYAVNRSVRGQQKDDEPKKFYSSTLLCIKNLYSFVSPASSYTPPKEQQRMNNKTLLSKDEDAGRERATTCQNGMLVKT